MGLIRRLKTIIIGKPHFKLKHDHRTVYAFTAGGVDYFEMENKDDLLSGRAFQALNFYNELSMKCTQPFLQAHTEAVKNILHNPKMIDIPELNKLNVQLSERLEMIIDSVTPYKVASIVYFDASEDPYTFDYQYAFKKIERWKKENVLSFFLSLPVKNLIPPSLLSEEVLESFMKITREIDKAHYQTILDSISTTLSDSEKKKEWYKTLKLEESII